MAMARAMTTTAAAGVLIAAPVHNNSITSSRPSIGSSRLVQLCSSFRGLSVHTSWQKQRSKYGGDISGLSAVSAAPNMSTTPKLVFTVAKIKTHKASAKRFRVTGTGKIMRRQAYNQHLLRKKNSKRKRRLSKMTQVNRSDYDNIIGALPYLKVKGRST